MNSWLLARLATRYSLDEGPGTGKQHSQWQVIPFGCVEETEQIPWVTVNALYVFDGFLVTRKLDAMVPVYRVCCLRRFHDPNRELMKRQRSFTRSLWSLLELRRLMQTRGRKHLYEEALSNLDPRPRLLVRAPWSPGHRAHISGARDKGLGFSRGGHIWGGQNSGVLASPSYLGEVGTSGNNLAPPSRERSCMGMLAL